MAKIATAERVSRELSDNFVFQRSLLAYHFAAKQISGRVLEIGTGSGYGVDIIAPNATEFISIDKFLPAIAAEDLPQNVELVSANVPPIPFDNESFDYVISFQVIEHIKQDAKFVAEIYRVLKNGGRFIVSTPNIDMSLTRNPWHVREYTTVEFAALLSKSFDMADIERLGVSGNQQVMEYYEKNKASVRKFTRFDIFRMQWWLPRWILQIPYDILNRINRRKLLNENQELTSSIKMDDYSVVEANAECFDLLYIAKK
ncbi:MAG: class I SAM-dependent methyltransferase [Rikenellaceae bacterium]